MDVLSLLRDAICAKHSVEHDAVANVLVFRSGARHDCAAATSYHASQGKGDPYNLGTVWFYVTNSGLGLAAYRKDTQTRGFDRVARIDQRDLLAYVSGQIDTSVAIKEGVTTIFDDVAPAAKRAKLDEQAAAAAEPVEPTNVDAEAAAAETPAAPVPVAAAPKAQDGAYLPAVSSIRDIVGQEKVLRTRNSILLAQDKNNFRDIESILKSVKLQKQVESQASTQSKIEQHLSDRSRQKRSISQADPGAAMNTQMRGTDYEGMKIDASSSITSAAAGAAKRPPERKAGDPKRSLGSLRKQAPSAAAVEAPPIIIVPSQPTSLITMYNAKSLLIDGVFIPTVEAKASGGRREERLKIERKLPNGETKTYVVVDNPSRLSKADWARVAMLFVANGALWQFKGFPFKNVPVDIFSAVCGFHLHYSDLKPDPKIGNWAVNTLTLSKDKRFTDMQQQVRIWDYVDKFTPKTVEVLGTSNPSGPGARPASSANGHRRPSSSGRR